MDMSVRLALGLWLLLMSGFVFVSGYDLALIGIGLAGYMIGSGLLKKME
jgi:hypothetical protein